MGGRGLWAERWNEDEVVAGESASARRWIELSGEWGLRRSVFLHKNYTAWVRKSYLIHVILQHFAFLFVLLFFQTLVKFRQLKWLTYPRVQGKLLCKVLHLCCVDLVVKRDKIAPLPLWRSWIMCGWCIGGRDVVPVVSIICNQQHNKWSHLMLEIVFLLMLLIWWRS